MSRFISTIACCGVVVLATALTACGHGDNGHSVDLGGVNHRDGNTDPLVNCVACHGGDLRGRSGPNCYGCHSSNGHATTYGSGGTRHNQPGVDCTRCHGPENRGGLGPACVSASCHGTQPR